MSRTEDNVLAVGSPRMGGEDRTISHVFTAGDGQPPNRAEEIRRWRTDGVYLDRYESCRYQPPVLLLPKDPAVGAKWRARSACDDADWTLSFEILRFEVVRIGGEDVPCVVVQRIDEAGGDVPGEVRRVQWWDRSRGLIVQQDKHLSYQGPVSRTRLKLMSLEPERG